MLIGFIFYTINYFLQCTAFSSVLSHQHFIKYLNYCIIFVCSTFILLIVIGFADKWRNVRHLILTITVGVIIPIAFFIAYNNKIDRLSTLSVFEWFIIATPYTALVYSFIVKAFKYRNNVGRLILSISLAIKAEKVPKKYRLFVRKDLYNSYNKKTFHNLMGEKCFLSLEQD